VNGKRQANCPRRKEKRPGVSRGIQHRSSPISPTHHASPTVDKDRLFHLASARCRSKRVRRPRGEIIPRRLAVALRLPAFCATSGWAAAEKESRGGLWLATSVEDFKPRRTKRQERIAAKNASESIKKERQIEQKKRIERGGGRPFDAKSPAQGRAGELPEIHFTGAWSRGNRCLSFAAAPAEFKASFWACSEGHQPGWRFSQRQKAANECGPPKACPRGRNPACGW